jgi:hypothetical protein
LFSNIDRALAAANLLNIGFESDQIQDIVGQWCRRQYELSVSNLPKNADSLSVVDNIEVDPARRLVATFHYSSYPHIYRWTALRSKDRQVVSLIGEQSEAHEATLVSLARKFDFDIRFVRSGPSMIKNMRQALALGHAGIIMLDVPWSKGGTKPDTEYPTGIGSFQALSTMLRLIRMIDPDYLVLVARPEAEGLSLNNVATREFDAAFGTLADLILERPEDYERLHQVHRFCRLPHAKSARIYTSVDGDCFALDAKTMKTYRVKDAEVDIPFDRETGLHVTFYA